MRIRSIKPEFWRSQDISSLNRDDRLLFIGLWSYVDDNGVGVDRLPVIAADLFADDLSRDPRDTLDTLSRGLANLSDSGLIHRYNVSGKDYLQVVSWDKHQKIDRPAKPRYPRSSCDDASIREDVATPSRESRDGLATGAGEQRSRGTEEQVAGAAAPLFSPRCPKHIHDADPPKCPGCRDARVADEAGQRTEIDRRREVNEARLREIQDCPEGCAPHGRVLRVNDDGTEVMDECPAGHHKALA